MHISLDSALGRQRRLNQVGETISSIAAPTAAYSLRSITGGDPKVVRVRRESDNNERDFTASEVSSGALVDFVNTQVTAPLDIQALTATGRDGDFLIAKAAYSLRSLGTRQATVAATGDTVARADGKYVCQVRSVTGDIKSFTADEVSDGTLVDFILGNTKSLLNSRAYFDASNDEVVLTNEITMSGDFSIQYSFVVTETGRGERILGRTTTYYIAVEGTGEIDKFKAQVGSSGVTMNLTSNLKFGEANTIKFKRVSGKVGIYDESDTLISNEVTASGDFVVSSFGRARGQFAKGVIYNIRIDTNNDGTINHSYNGYGNTLSDWTDLIGSNNASAVNGSPALFTGQDQDGFVKTWYDQSVTTEAGDTATGNHATQATAASQPKIVSAGSLLTAGVTFDGTDDHLDLTSTLGITSVASHFVVTNLAGLDDNTLFDNRDSSTDGYSIRTNDTSNINFDWLTSDAEVANASGQAVYYFNKTSSQVQSGANGGTLVTASESGSVSVAATPRIGSRSFTSPFNFFNGPVQELIIYASDQTDNRTAIEANIGEHYSISGIPAFDNSVNGFVETWYDQSGNGNDAVQATASKQPKIVSAGSLLNELVFDGSDDFLQTAANFDAFGANSLAFFTVINPSDLSGNPRFLNTRSATPGIEFVLTTNPRLYYKDSGGTGTNGDTQSASLSTGTEVLYTNLVDRDTDQIVEAFKNGSSVTISSPTDLSSVGSVNAAELTIGANNSGGNLYNGKTKEIIIYASNQEANRTALETNINGHYSIF